MVYEFVTICRFKFISVVCLANLASHVITRDLTRHDVIYLQEHNRPYSYDLKVG